MTSTFARILSELSDPIAQHDGMGHDHSPYHLASLADCGSSPDNRTSPGAVFLARIAQDVAEHCNQYAGTPEDGDDWPLIVGELTDGDAAHEIADSAVPVYTHERWITFVDLAAYDEDVSEYGAMDDLTNAAGVALYMIAERLVRALADELSAALDTDAEDADEDEDDGGWLIDSTHETVAARDARISELGRPEEEIAIELDDDGNWRVLVQPTA